MDRRSFIERIAALIGVGVAAPAARAATAEPVELQRSRVAGFQYHQAGPGGFPGGLFCRDLDLVGAGSPSAAAGQATQNATRARLQRPMSSSIRRSPERRAASNCSVPRPKMPAGRMAQLLAMTGSKAAPLSNHVSVPPAPTGALESGQRADAGCIYTFGRGGIGGLVQGVMAGEGAHRLPLASSATGKGSINSRTRASARASSAGFWLRTVNRKARWSSIWRIRARFSAPVTAHSPASAF